MNEREKMECPEVAAVSAGPNPTEHLWKVEAETQSWEKVLTKPVRIRADHLGRVWSN